MIPLPQNFNFYICGQDNIQQYINKNINWVVGYNHPGNDNPPDFTPLGELKHFTLFEYHDAWATHHPDCLKWPDYTLAERIISIKTMIDFALSNGEEVNILFCCAAGISRSTATAYTIMCLILNNEKEALAHVLQRRWEARPNPLIVSLVDKLCGWNGRMTRHLEKVLDIYVEKLDSDRLLLF